jgi:hypothetical protein
MSLEELRKTTKKPFWIVNILNECQFEHFPQTSPKHLDSTVFVLCYTVYLLFVVKNR